MAATTSDLANWPSYDGLDDEPQTVAAWQNPDDGNLLVVERGTGSWRDELEGYSHFVVLRNSPFWQDDHVLRHIARCKSKAEAFQEAEAYMADNQP